MHSGESCQLGPPTCTLAGSANLARRCTSLQLFKSYIESLAMQYTLGQLTSTFNLRQLLVVGVGAVQCHLQKPGSLGHCSSTALLLTTHIQPSCSSAETTSLLLSPCLSCSGPMSFGPPHPEPTAFSHAVRWLEDTLRNLSCQ